MVQTAHVSLYNKVQKAYKHLIYVTNKVCGKSEQYNDMVDPNHQNVWVTCSCNYMTQTFHLLVNLTTQPWLIICSAKTWQVSCLYSVAGNYTTVRRGRVRPVWSHLSVEHSLPDAPFIMRKCPAIIRRVESDNASPRKCLYCCLFKDLPEWSWMMRWYWITNGKDVEDSTHDWSLHEGLWRIM
jgi:hypothetical protein